MKTSIEVTYWVVDDDGELVRSAPSSLSGEGASDAEPEPVVRLETPPCDSTLALRSAFASRLESALSRASEAGTRLVPLGTPIHAGAFERRREGREASASSAEPLADPDAYVAGTTLRVEERNVPDQLNVLLALDPAFALLNSSPYLRGERVANGARAFHHQERALESDADPGPRRDYVDDVEEWTRRPERRIGSSGETAHDEDGGGAAWAPIRLRSTEPAVEWRSPDAALPSQILRLAGAVADVMEVIDETTVRRERDGLAARVSGDPDGSRGPGAVTNDGVVLPPIETVRRHVERAIRDGLESRPLVAYLERMGFSVAEYHPISMQIDGRAYVTRSDARELRLEYASRLEEDVADLA